MDEYDRLQALLEAIRDMRSGGVAAQLARDLDKDQGYIHRLFYERGRKHAKGIGPEIMDACRVKFDLPRGFWEMSPAEARSALAPRSPQSGLANEETAFISTPTSEEEMPSPFPEFFTDAEWHGMSAAERGAIAWEARKAFDQMRSKLGGSLTGPIGKQRRSN